MKCNDPKCMYCSDQQPLVIPFRVRMPYDMHSILRRNYENVSEYIRELILEDLHSRGLAQNVYKILKPEEKEAPTTRKQKKEVAPEKPDFKSMAARGWL